MSKSAGRAPDHGGVDNAPLVAPPVAAADAAPCLTAAEQARTLVAATNVAALATLTASGARGRRW